MFAEPVMTTIIVAAVALLLYPIGMYVLDEKLQPLRLGLADTAYYLLNKDLSDKDLKFVETTANNAFNWRSMIMFSFFLPPLMVKHFGSKSRGEEIPSAPAKTGGDRETGKAMRDLTVKFFFSTAAANPVVALIVFFELAIFWVALRIRGDANNASDKIYKIFFNSERHMIRS